MRIVLFCFLLILICSTISPTMAFSLFKSKTTTPSPYRSNDVRSRTTTKPIKPNEFEKVGLMFDAIKSRVKGKYGYVCIYLDEKYGNEIRKLFVKSAMDFGFEDVEIINYETVIYLNGMSKINYKLSNGNIIWIKRMNTIYVWEKENEKAKFVGSYLAKTNNIQRIVDELKWGKTPDVLLYFDETGKFYASSTCKFFFCGKSSYVYSTESLLKIRIKLGDPDLAYLNTENFLSQRIELIMKNRKITSFDIGQQLPINYYQNMIKKMQHAVLEIRITGDKIETLHLPNYDKIYMQFHMDTNGIYSVIFKQHEVDAISEKKPAASITKSEKLPNNETYITYNPIVNSLENNLKTSKRCEIYATNLKIDSNEHDLISNFHKIVIPPNIPTIPMNRFVETSANLNFNKCYTIPLVTTYDRSVNAVGIDLGTSRCCVAVNRKEGIYTAPLDNTGERLLPSYVSYDEPNVKCGKVVYNRMRNHSRSTVFDSKRIIGRTLSDIEIDSFWPFEISENEGKVFLEVKKFDGKGIVYPVDVAAVLLKHIKQKTEEFQGKKLSAAVITVPAAFNESQKAVTLEAAKLAGWETIHLLPEPIAAAFAYFNDRPIPNNSNLLLFDLGGGTLDICIFKIQNSQIEIISNTGDSKFGGRDFDNILINYFQYVLQIKYGISLRTKNKKYLLMIKCQEMKESLSSMNYSYLDVDNFDPNQEGTISVSHEDFEKMCGLLLNKIKNSLNAALYHSELNANQIEKVLLVGGGSRMPMVKNLLKSIFPNADYCCEKHPDEVVAIGASYYAYSIFSES